MYGNKINVGLPIVTNTEPRSLSYFKYAKNAMKAGDLNPNYSAVQMPYHPYHQPSTIDPLYRSQDVLLDKINLGKHPYLNSYPLPPIRKNKEPPIKELKTGELVDFPDETYIPLSKFVDYKNKKELELKMTKEKQKAKEEERRRIELYGINGDKKPSGASDLVKFHKKNLKHWRFMKNATNIICGYLRMKKLALAHKDLHARRFVLIQAAKEGMATIRDFLLPILSNIENFCAEFFKSTIIFTTNNPEKLENSVFTLKSFIHQLFSDLTSALAKKDDIPLEVKRVINSYIKDGSLLPYGFLSTFEFNRLEFTTEGLLTNMNLDRQGLLVCFIVLYRILLADIFKRYLFYFKKIREIDLDEITLLELFEKKLEEYELRLKEKNQRSKLKILKRGQIPGIEEEEDEEEKQKREKQEKEEENKIFERDEIQEEAHRKRDNQETWGLESHHACPPKKKKKIEKSDSEEENNDDDDEDKDENGSNESDKNDSEENSDESEKKSKIKKSKTDKGSSEVSSSKKISSKKSDIKSSNNKTKSSKTESKKSESKSSSNNNKNKKDDKKNSKKSSKKDEDKDKEDKKLKGKEYNYSGYYDKKKGKYDHEKGIYFKDDREKGVNKELLKEEERLREEKLKEKLENSNSSKSSIEEEEEDESSEEKEDKNKDKNKNKDKKSSNTNTNKSSSIKNSKKSSSNKSPSESSSIKPKNINEEFWGIDLGRKEDEERKKREIEVSEEVDPLQERKNRVKKLPKEIRIKILEEEREKLKLKVKHNFHIVTNILHSIIRDTMAENVPFFSEYYKEKFLYKALVFQKTHKQYSNGNDEIELSRGIIIDEETTELFMTKNQRWAQMYKLLVFQFCRDFAIKCKEEK